MWISERHAQLLSYHVGATEGRYTTNIDCDGFGATLEQEPLDHSTRPILFISRAILKVHRFLGTAGHSTP